MPELVKIIKILRVFFPRNYEVFEAIIEAILTMNGSKTMLNISRWTKEKACYKTISRFYDREIHWLAMNLMLIVSFVNYKEEVLLASDETIQGKSGKKTSGIDVFFSSILQKPIKSICLSGVSLIIPEKEKSYPLFMNQLIYTEEEKAKLIKDKLIRKDKNKSKNKVGRPKNSKNKSKAEEKLAPTFRLLEEQLIDLNKFLKLKVKHFLGDGKYGNNTVLTLCKKYNLFLISKLQKNSALYFEYTGEYSGRGKPITYGDKLDYNNIPIEYLVKHEINDKVDTKIYQMKLLSRTLKGKLNVVIVQKTVDKKVAHIIFFSNDLDLPYQKIVDYYSLRFQIEFNFRDAKEFWGLSDFMNIKKEKIHNASNLAFFMCNLSNILLDKFREKQKNTSSGIRDLISYFKADYYFNQTLKLLLKNNPNILVPDDLYELTSIGAIHV